MAKAKVITGYSKNNLPYTCIGNSPRKLVIFDGLDFSHKPPSGMMLRMTISMYSRLIEHFKVYIVSRKPGLPDGYSIRDMSEDYATMIRDEIGEAVDIMGISTGGPMVQYFAVDHPELTKHLVLAATGYRLSERGRELQRRVGELARQRKWGAAYSTLATGIYPHGIKKYLFKLFMYIFGAFGAPKDPSDGLVEIEAEDKHNFKKQLPDIKVPTLVIGGEEDYFYPVRETADGIPNARLILYKGTGHNAVMKRQFAEDVLAFLKGD